MLNPTSQSALPFVMPTANALFASPKKVFAHYFYPFPLSIDNAAPATDYYNRNYLTVGGEGGIHSAYGGYLRARPLPVSIVSAPANFKQVNMQLEIAMAISRGITGFCIDILSLSDALSSTGNLQTLLAAAAATDLRFVISPMLDMSSLGAITVGQTVSIIQAIAASPSLAKLPDGRIVITAFDASLQTGAWWQSVFLALNALGIDIAFVPVLLGAPSDAGSLNPISYGVGGWGTATPLPAAALTTTAAHAIGLVTMLPMLTQQFRPKNSCFWEASNSVSFRNAWVAAIAGNSDWVQVVTWSDFSESGQIQPYTDATLNPSIGSGFYDLNAYFAAWFLTGVQPVVTQDVLYWFYRAASASAAHANQPNAFTPVGPAEEESIECVAFLMQPGTVMINTTSFAGVAGINSFKIPSAVGTPTFALERNGSNVFAFTAPVQIYGPAGLPSGVLDLTYWSGSLTRNGITQYSH